MGTTACTSEHCLLCKVAWPCSLADDASMDGQGRLILLVCCSLFAVSALLKSTYNTDLCSTEDSQPGLYQLGGCLRRVTAHICCPREQARCISAQVARAGRKWL